MAENPLTELERALTAAAVLRAAPVAVRRPRRHRHRRLVLVLALGALLMAAAAWATISLLGTGRPVPYRFGKPAAPHSGYGAPASVAMAAPVADPEGGLPWGLRIVHTTRGYGCVQIGRLYQGQLGVIGEHGAFHDDGLFHPLPPDHLSSRARCVPLDGRGDPYVAEHVGSVSESGALMCRLDRRHQCGPELTRTLDYGTAGPDAVRILYRAAGEPLQTVTPGPDGAYLIVLAHQPLGTITTPGGHVVNDGLLLTATAASHVIKRVEYRDGTTCVVHPTREFPGGCPGHGPAPVRVRLPKGSRLRTPLRLSVSGAGRGAVLHVAFRARVAANGSRSDYHLIVRPARVVRMPSRHYRFPTCDAWQSLPVGRDVSVGELVRIDLPVGQPGCRGTLMLELSYRVESGELSPRGPTSSYPGQIVDRARVTVP